MRKTPAVALDNPVITIGSALADTTTQRIRAQVLADRALHDKAQRAFVSWVRSYSKHQASSIFRVADLDWAELGAAWGLLKLPRMPELKGFAGDVSLGVDVDWDGYAYSEKVREKHRRDALEEIRNGTAAATAAAAAAEGAGQKRTASEADAGGSNAPWSKNVEKQSDKEKRRERKRTRREKDQWAKMTEEEREKIHETERMLEKVRKEGQAKKAADAKAAAGADDEEFKGFD